MSFIVFISPSLPGRRFSQIRTGSAHTPIEEIVNGWNGCGGFFRRILPVSIDESGEKSKMGSAQQRIWKATSNGFGN
jgi:hypothetical protein